MQPVAAAWQLHYTARLHGIGLLEADFCLLMEGSSYVTTLSARTLGLVDVLVHARSQSHASGAILAGTAGQAGAIAPHDFAEHSHLSGEDYAVSLLYLGGMPVLSREVPPQEKYRLAVPPDLLPGSIDGLSAVVVQSLAATHRGVCAGEVIYDGRQVRSLTMQAGRSEMLAPKTRSAFAGAALRCETVSTTLGGFLKSDPVASQSKPRHGTLWLAPVVAGGPFVPVRLVFDAEFLGDVIVDMDRVTREPGCLADKALD